MADIYEISVDGGVTKYNIKDATARTDIASVSGRVTDIENSVGSNNGIAPLDNTGRVPSSNLPSYVDDVVEGYYKEEDGKFYEDSEYTTEITPEGGKIYVSLDTNKTYRWGGSAYVNIASSLAIGETQGTAYEGSKGKANADNISAINEKIPASASASNKLATMADIEGASTLEILEDTVGWIRGNLIDYFDSITGTGVTVNLVEEYCAAYVSNSVAMANAHGIVRMHNIPAKRNVKMTFYASIQIIGDVTQSQDGIGQLIGYWKSGSSTYQDTIEYTYEKTGDKYELSFYTGDRQYDSIGLVMYCTGDTAGLGFAAYDGITIRDDSLPESYNIRYSVEDKLKNIGELKANRKELKETVGWSCKNIIPVSLEAIKGYNTSGTWNGNVWTINNITFTVNDDGTITVTTGSGGASAKTDLKIHVFDSYRNHLLLTGCPSNGSSSRYELDTNYGNNVFRDYGSIAQGVTAIVGEGSIVNITIRSGAQLSNAVFAPMLRDADIEDTTYEPYHTSVDVTKANRDEIKDTIGWSGKNKAKSFHVESFTEQYYRALNIEFDIQPNTEYTFSFDTTNSGNQYYFNDSLFVGGDTITSDGTRKVVTRKTKGTIDSSQHNNTGWYVLKNYTAQSSAPSFSNVMVMDASIADDTYEPYHESVEAVLETKGDWDARNIATLYNCAVGGNNNDGYGFYSENNVVIYGNGKCLLTPIEAGKTYKISKKAGLGDRFWVVGLTQIPPYPDGTKVPGVEIIKDNSKSEYVYTSDGSYKYLFVGLNTKDTNLNGADIQGMIQLDSNENKSYTPHRDPLPAYLETKADWDARNVFNPYTDNTVPRRVTISNGGQSIKIKETTAGSYCISTWGNVLVKPNTDYVLDTDIDVVSGVGHIKIEEPNTTTAITYSSDYSADGHCQLKFNSGNFTSVKLVLACSWATSSAGEVNYNNLILQESSNAKHDYTPYRPTLEEVIPSKLSYADNGVLGAKNLCESRCPTSTDKGITFTKNSDGSYTISGTNDGSGSSTIRIDQSTRSGTDNLKSYNGNMTLSLLDANKQYVANTSLTLMQNDGLWTPSMQCDSSNNGIQTKNINVTNCFIYITIPKDANFSTPKTVYPMLRLASDPDSTYQPYAMTNRELTELLPTEYSTNGLTYTDNCSFVAGGYFKLGKIVFVNIRVLTSGTGNIVIDGFPTYTNKTRNSKNICPCKAYNMTDDSITNYYATINASGKLVVIAPTIANKEYAINGVYLCD